MAEQNNIEGTVFVEFIVHENGLTSDFKVLRGIGYGCDEEALRVTMEMPRWNPASNFGKPQKMYFTMSINFPTKNELSEKKLKKLNRKQREAKRKNNFFTSCLIQ